MFSESTVFRANLDCPCILFPLSPKATTLVTFLVSVLREEESKSVFAELHTPCLHTRRSFLTISEPAFFWLRECPLPPVVDVCVLSSITNATMSNFVCEVLFFELESLK